MRSLSKLVLLCLFVALMDGVILSQAPPSADSYVSSVMSQTNFGNSPILAVQSGTTSYVRLNLGGMPSKRKVVKATLRLYVVAVAQPGTFDAFAIMSRWSESGLTFNTAPVTAASATGGQSIAVTKGSLNQFVLVDVTALAAGWLDGSIPNNGIALILTSPTGSFAFESKESTGTGHHPELDVVFESSPALATAGTSQGPAKSAANGISLSAPDPYIDNGTGLQVGASFNIDGSGSATIVNATSLYQLGGAPVLGTSGTNSFFAGPLTAPNNTGTQNTFIGVSAGQSNGNGGFNTFAGASAGISNTTGSYNTFVGMQAGQGNTTGLSNSFFGLNSGFSNTTGNSNTFLGHSAGFSNSTGNVNTFVGESAGFSNTTGLYGTFIGTQAGLSNTYGESNSFLGTNSGYSNTTGSANTFLGVNAGLAIVGGSHNTFLGFNAGASAGPSGSNNIYVSNQGQPGDSGTIRIGDPASQTLSYIAGINGATTSSGVPVFVDSTGKLGTSGGSFNFTQVAGTLSSSQFTGSYTNQVTLSNATNIIDGSFTGNGGGLTGVNSGVSWPIVKKSSNYTVQVSDFSTPSTVGSFLVATGRVSLTFTLPATAPPNGDCVAIGNVIDAGINSGTNTFLTVNPSGLLVDASSTIPTMPRRTAYLYCSDGTGYYRLGFAQNGVSEIGPWLYTVDTGTQNALTTTFRNGMDFGLSNGSMIFILPKFPNTSGTPTLDVNGLGAKKILRYGNQALAPGDLTTNALALLIFDGLFWELVNPQTINGTVTAVTATAPLVSTGTSTPNISCPTCVTSATLTGTTGTIGGAMLTPGTCTSGSASVTGATIGHPVSVSASDGSLPDGFTILSAAVTGANTVTVQLCAVANNTPVAKTYNVATQ